MEKIQGYINHFIYRNEINGYCVVSLQTEDDELICVGNFPGIDQGECVEITEGNIDREKYANEL